MRRLNKGLLNRKQYREQDPSLLKKGKIISE